MKKKLFVLLFAGMMALSATACGIDPSIMAEAQNINYSSVLQSALEKQLNITR